MRLAVESCSYSKPKGTLTKRVYMLMDLDLQSQGAELDFDIVD